MLRQHRAIRHGVIATPCDRVRKARALREIFLVEHILARKEARLPDPRLWRDVDEIATLEPRHMAADVIEQVRDMLAALYLGARQVFDLQPVQSRHVRTVAPHDAGQRGFQPPVRPRVADPLLCLFVQNGECGWLPVFEALRRIGVDTSQAEHRRHDVTALDMRCARRRRNVEIAGCIDDDVAQDRLASGLGLADDALDLAIFHQRAREPGMQPQLNPELLHPFERNALPAVRVERSREANRVRCLVAVEIERTPARPAAIAFGQLAPFVLTRKRGQLQLRQTLDHRHASAAHRYFLVMAVPHVVEHQNHAARGEAAQVVVALEQRHFRAVARGRQGSRHSRGTAADHDHIGLCRNTGFAGRLDDPITDAIHC